MVKERIEDLGALRVMIDNILDHEIFNLYHGRNKDFAGWFFEKTEDDRYELLHKVIYGLESIKEQLYACLEIAKGEYSMNTSDEL